MKKRCRDRLLINPVFACEADLDAFLADNKMVEIKRDEVSCGTLVLIGDETPCEYIVILRKGE